MNAPDLAKLFDESWPSIVGAVIGSLVGFIGFRRSPNIRRIRKLVGRGLDRLSSVPAAVLDRELLSAAELWRNGLRGVLSFLAFPASFAAAIVLSNLVRQSFPDLPHSTWWLALGSGALVGLCAWASVRRERRFILQHIRHLHP
jgi:hypothetical protein